MSSEYTVFTPETLESYIDANETLKALIGAKPYTLKEFGDGNLNLIFLVSGTKQSVVIKQALPYVRCVGPEWGMSPKRNLFECRSLEIEYNCCSVEGEESLVPKLLYADKANYLFVMEYISPHINLRHGIIKGIEHPNLSTHAGLFLARSLFYTSDLYMSSSEKRELCSYFSGNVELCALTEQVIFTEPFTTAKNNNWLTPHLDSTVEMIQSDAALKVEVGELKRKFMTCSEALLHGDLHTGSTLVTPEDTKFIDSEFAFVGPMGFDIGLWIGNLVLGYYSQDLYESSPAGDTRDKYRAHLKGVMVKTWEVFHREFLALWDKHGEKSSQWNSQWFGEGKDAEMERARVSRTYMQRVLQDAIGFSGVVVIRRIIGIAGAEELTSVTAPEERVALRAKCEKRALHFARHIVLNAKHMSNMNQLVDLL